MRHDSLVRGYAVTHPRGEVRMPAQPGWHQVIYATSGSLVVRTPTREWTVPPRRAVCIGDATSVGVRTGTRTRMRCLYLPASLGALAGRTWVVELTPLAREALVHAVERCPLDLDRRVDAALVAVLVDQLVDDDAGGGRWPTARLHLPWPADARARALADAVVADPAVPLDTHLSAVPASRRAIERLFRAETALSPAGWQRRARVLAAVRAMGAGASVTAAAGLVGYATPSAFVGAFRSELGTTPRAFMRGG